MPRAPSHALPNLQYLELRDNNIGDAAWNISNGSTRSDFSMCVLPAVTDAGLAHLTGLTRLVALRLRSPAISDVASQSLPV